MSTLNTERARKLLQRFDLETLFIEELGWDRHREQLPIEVDNLSFTLHALAEKRGLVVFLCSTPQGTEFPPYPLRRKIERKVAKIRHEHLIIYIDQDKTRQVWQWVKREPGRPDACREHTFHKGQPGDALIQKLAKLMVTLAEEESIGIVDMAGRTRAAFNVEKITKKFYELFKEEHTAFLKFVDGITEMGDRQWYASIMLNRLMFVYFIQKKSFLDNDLDYLRNRLRAMQKEQGKGNFHSFYRHFLLRLFHEGLGKKKEERSQELDRLLGKVPYLNGGLFDVHELEQEYHDIRICDDAFERLFAFFEQYHWHLDERPLRKDNEINPDVLGYIFEKYINQKQMGAYYTKEDITEYIGKNTIIPYLFDAARKKCKIAFEGEQSVWNLLRKDPDRYIYGAVRKGCDLPLPPEIGVGVDTKKPNLLKRRKNWNRPAPEEYALPTEIWREVVARRLRYEEVRARLAASEVSSINDFITYNLNIRQFTQDVIENCEGPELLRAFWQAITGITILDPTCGSGAFLFAALDILEPLYEACLDRMQTFVAELEFAQDKPHPEKFKDFKAELARVAAHPNQSYFIMKSIILNNLYGVDIMAEAVEICKLRLFLKMVAQVEQGDRIEPLPDIDFNIRCGNTLVGFATYGEVKEAVTTARGAALLPGMDAGRMARIERKAQDLQQAFNLFRRRQVEGDGSVPHADKEQVRARLAGLDEELNKALAGKYGINAENDKRAYAKWLASHQPFHWFIEYYGIMADGGFDVIIGNPPYVEYKDVKKIYIINGFQTLSCGDLYAFCAERTINLLRLNGALGLIVPISIFGTDGFESLQKLTLGSLALLWVSCFSNRPSQLFEGAQKRLTILIGRQSEDKKPTASVYTTQYIRWRKEEFKNLFRSRILYAPLHKQFSVFPTSLEKLGSKLEVDAFNRLVTVRKKLAGAISNTTKCRVYYTRKFGYFLAFMDFIPAIIEIKTGDNIQPTELKELGFQSTESVHAAVAALSSSIFFWFWNVLSDCRNLNRRDLLAFPFDPEQESPFLKTKLAECGRQYLADLKKNSRTMHKCGLKIETFEYAESKPIIDEIDRALAKHYGFTEEELDFIINYDIKYRMGLGTASADDDSGE